MKKLPLGIQSFENIRKTGNSIYIDKTKYIYDLINSTDNPKIFLSRPRRFGKSLLIDTIRGYSFGRLDETLYNPFGLLNFFGIISKTGE